MSERPPRTSRPPAGRPRIAARLPSAEARALAKTVPLGESEAASVATIMATLPDPTTLAPGTLVLVPGEAASPRSLARSVLAVFGRSKAITRARRCTALVARGYVDVGAAEDDARVDLAWGYAPGSPPPDGA